MMINRITPYSPILYTHSFSMRRGKKMQGQYKKVNQNFDPSDASQKLTQKYSKHPIAIKGMVMMLPEYLSGNINARTFSTTFLDRTPALLTRIEYGKDGQEFSNKYQREVSLIKSLSHFCYEFNNEKIKQEDFDNFVEVHVKELLRK